MKKPFRLVLLILIVCLYTLGCNGKPDPNDPTLKNNALKNGNLPLTIKGSKAPPPPARGGS